MFFISRYFSLWEKVMKKLFVILMIGALSLCAFGCKKKEADKPADPPADTEKEAPETPDAE